MEGLGDKRLDPFPFFFLLRKTPRSFPSFLFSDTSAHDDVSYRPIIVMTVESVQKVPLPPVVVPIRYTVRPVPTRTWLRRVSLLNSTVMDSEQQGHTSKPSLPVTEVTVTSLVIIVFPRTTRVSGRVVHPNKGWLQGNLKRGTGQSPEGTGVRKQPVNCFYLKSLVLYN